jgi:RNA polymerase sigma-70 factor (ECF subfamily)
LVIDEKELIARILSGESDLFAVLVRSHQAQIYQLCLAFLSDPHEAEEAAQSTFIKAYGSLARFRHNASFRTWITRIGINHCKDVLKSWKRSKTVSLEIFLEDGTPLPRALVSEPQDEEVEVGGVPTEALGRLSRGERMVLEKAGEQVSIDYGLLGKELGLSRDGVKGRLKRARLKVRAYMKRKSRRTRVAGPLKGPRM